MFTSDLPQTHLLHAIVIHEIAQASADRLAARRDTQPSLRVRLGQTLIHLGQRLSPEPSAAPELTQHLA